MTDYQYLMQQEREVKDPYLLSSEYRCGRCGKQYRCKGWWGVILFQKEHECK